MTAQEKDRIECAIRHIQTAVDVDPWAVEIAVEAMKTQLSAEGTTSDLISRQDAIEVIEKSQMTIMRSIFPEEQFVFKGMSEALSAIKDLPSAQPEPCEDAVSREAVTDVIRHSDIFSTWYEMDDTDDIVAEVIDEARKQLVDDVNELPSVTPKCPECDDVVSRRAAIDVAENAFVRGLLASPDIRKLPSVQPDIKQAAKLLSDFIESCPGGDSYLITPDGEKLRTDWGYAMEGMQLIHDWAERRTDEGD